MAYGVYGSSFSTAGPAPISRGAEQEGYRAINRLTTELIRSRARFGGDLDRLLIVLVFMLGRMEAMQKPAHRRRIEGLNALSIADITGLPRETARRKLLGLVDTGDLIRGSDGLYSCCGDLESLLADVEPLLGLRAA